MYPLQIQYQIFKKLLLCFINFFIRICDTKKCYHCTPNWLKPLLQLLSMISISNFLNNDQLYLSNQFGCVDSMLVFIGVITLSLLYLMKLFCKVDCWHKSLALANILLRIIHRNIYEFSIFIGKLSLATKRALANSISIMWLLSYNLDLYNCKLDNFNPNTICCNNRMSSSSSKMSCNNLHMHILNI